MYKHRIELEERYFSEDVNALMGYDDDFKTAYCSGEKYEMTILLSILGSLCPRYAIKKQAYHRLMAFLMEKGITMKIISRKKEKKQ